VRVMVSTRCAATRASLNKACASVTGDVRACVAAAQCCTSLIRVVGSFWPLSTFHASNTRISNHLRHTRSLNNITSLAFDNCSIGGLGMGEIFRVAGAMNVTWDSVVGSISVDGRTVNPPG
jgi:hypothetical protein